VANVRRALLPGNSWTASILWLVAKAKNSTSHLATSELRVPAGKSPHFKSRDKGDDGSDIIKKGRKNKAQKARTQLDR